MRGLRTVGLFIPGTPGFFSDVLLGVKGFARAKWAVEVAMTIYDATGITRDWRPDGVLIYSGGGDWGGLIDRLGVPVVLIGGDALPHLPRVLTDDTLIGQTAGHYLLGRGFRHFAFCGYEAAWSNRRDAGYRGVLAAAGFDCAAHRGERGVMSVADIPGVLASWIASLPKPVAIFCCHDRIAMFVGHACATLGVAVPDDVAILGVDNNPLECDFTRPPLSSVTGSARRLGYQAAQLLDGLIDGRPPPAAPLLIAPAGVKERASTDVFASADPDLTAALRFIHAHADRPLRVSDVAKAVIVTRRMLERKFNAQLGRSPRQEILRAQITRAKDLLIQTDLSALDVALRSGFRSGPKLSETFKRETGLTPTAFRRLYGSAADDRPGRKSQ